MSAVAPNVDPDRILESIWDRVVTPRSDCLLWVNATDRGYGRIGIGGTVYRVHRVVWELINGPIPEGLTIDHLCRVRNCLNVEHMELVTGSENARRAAPYKPRRSSVRGPQTPRTPKTHCKHGHEFTPENTRTKPNGHRVCRECDRLDSLERRKRKASA